MKTFGHLGWGGCTAVSWLIPGAPLLSASKSLAAQQAARGYWQASIPVSFYCEVWRPTYQSDLQVGACSKAYGLHMEPYKCLQAASIAGWVPASRVACGACGA